MDPAGLARGQTPGRPRRRRAPSPTRHAGTGRGEAGAAVPRRWACSSQIDTSFEPARSSQWHDQNLATRLRETRRSVGDGEKLKRLRRVWASPAATLDDRAPGGVRAAPDCAEGDVGEDEAAALILLACYR